MGSHTSRVTFFLLFSTYFISCSTIVKARDHKTLPIITTVKRTSALIEYDDSPNTPDVDDPAIYVDSATNRTIVLATVKNAGLAVYDEYARLKQWLAPPNRPIVSAADPPTPAGLNDVESSCRASRSGETYGRFNNVVLLSLPSFKHPVAVVTDRGCDTLRFFKISDDVKSVNDITANNVPRVFRTRLQYPSPFQAGEKPGLFSNLLDEQSTAYGIGAWPGKPFVFVSQRSRSTIAQLRVRVLPDGTITYNHVRLFLFDPVYTLSKKNENGTTESYVWTPCREEPLNEDPQSEGVAITKDGTLFVGFETTGVYRVPLKGLTYDDTVIHVGLEHLVIPVKEFGMSYAAIPADDNEFECEYDTTKDRIEGVDGAVFVEGAKGNGGNEVTADVEGITLLDDKYMIVSSQGDSSFHVYETSKGTKYIGGFRVWGVEDTDGLEVTSQSVGTMAFKDGLLVVHNGEAKVPNGTPEEINGYELDGATQLAYVRLSDVRKALGLK